MQEAGAVFPAPAPAPCLDILDVYCGNYFYEHLNKCLFTPDRAGRRNDIHAQVVELLDVFRSLLGAWVRGYLQEYRDLQAFLHPKVPPWQWMMDSS